MAKIKDVKGGEDVKVKVVSNSGAADLLVYMTDKSHEARGKDEIWSIVNSSQDVKVRFVTGGEDLKVYYVDRKHQAKWRKSHELRGRIG